MEPETIQNLISTTMYEKRFGPYFTEPVVAGLSRVSCVDEFSCLVLVDYWDSVLSRSQAQEL